MTTFQNSLNTPKECLQYSLNDMAPHILPNLRPPPSRGNIPSFVARSTTYQESVNGGNANPSNRLQSILQEALNILEDEDPSDDLFVTK